jgi:hypothetical protein
VRIIPKNTVMKPINVITTPNFRKSSGGRIWNGTVLSLSHYKLQLYRIKITII